MLGRYRELHWWFCAVQTPEVAHALHAGPLPPGPHCVGHMAAAHWLLTRRLIALLGARAAQHAQEQAGPAFWVPQRNSQSAALPQVPLPAGTPAAPPPHRTADAWRKVHR